MAIATVMTLWTFVEILGHIGILKEIWLEPTEHVVAMSVLAALFLGLGEFTVYKAVKK